MKIGIITFQCAHNYGAVLQAYGLKEYLKSLGHSVNIINYRPHCKVNTYRKINPRYWLSKNPYKCVIRLFTEIRIKPIRFKRWYAFENFMNEYLDLYPLKKNEDYSNFDIIILGSDQIWNPNLTGGTFDKVYFGDKAKCNVISYAASSRFETLSEYQKSFFTEHLTKLKYISVRESSLANLLQPLVKTNIETVLDPTILAGKKIFDRIAIPPNRKKYLLLYQIGQWTDLNILANEVAKKLNLEVIEITSHPIKSKKGLIQTSSPCDFIGYFQEASFVITTSFHGLAFSILYNKEFYCLRQNTNADLRLLSLLNKLGLKDRLLEHRKEAKFEKINYIEVNKKLKNEVHFSEKYLEKALN